MAGRPDALVLIFLCVMSLEAFSCVFFFIDRAWRSQVFQGFLSLPFCTVLDHRVLQQWKLCRLLWWAIGLCRLSHEGQQVEEHRAFYHSFSSSDSCGVAWEPGLILRVTFQMCTLTHIKLFTDVLNESDIAAFCLSATVQMQTFGWRFK